MRRLVLVMVAVAVCAVLVGAVVSTASAQNKPSPVPVVPPACENMARYDHNHDGHLTHADFDLWVWTVHESSETCKINGPASGCPSWVDVNGDGIVSTLDLDAMFRFMFTCLPSPRVR